ncbi:MAG: GNAT family N-acetyltransferase [Actinobacteria bacterium]|nr:GNAT family N-acetyltransferase [Actinomycetota bacterium]MBV8599853.1 GNAT family N-acetyltransferase [Actinomycetota bacterium]
MIKEATDADAALVHAMEEEFAREVPDELWPDDQEAGPYDAVLLADDVGIAALIRKSDRAWLLDLLYVRPPARGVGTGTELVRAAAEYVKAQGAQTLALQVLEKNAAARRLYDHLGFAAVERLLAAPVDALLSATSEGPTFGAVHVQTDDVEKVRREAAKVLRSDPDLAVAGGWVRVRSDSTDADPERLKTLARELSYTTAGVTLALGVERGAVVRYNLYDRGSDVDEYLSVPEFYGELPPGDVYAMGANATVLARLTGADPHRVREVAKTATSASELPPAQELYEQLAAVIGVQP